MWHVLVLEERHVDFLVLEERHVVACHFSGRFWNTGKPKSQRDDMREPAAALSSALASVIGLHSVTSKSAQLRILTHRVTIRLPN